MTATITIERARFGGRPVEHITVALRHSRGRWRVVEAIDEDGDKVLLTEDEASQARRRAAAGEDETGR